MTQGTAKAMFHLWLKDVGKCHRNVSVILYYFGGTLEMFINLKILNYYFFKKNVKNESNSKTKVSNRKKEKRIH